MKRRDFLAGIGLGSYSLVVRADGAEGTSSPPPLAAPGAKPEFRTIAPPDADRKASPVEPHMTQVDLDVDVFIAGGGMSGVIAAVSAARHGAKVVLAQDRSRLRGHA